MTLSYLAKYSMTLEASCGLSATAELFVICTLLCIRAGIATHVGWSRGCVVAKRLDGSS